jgi:hypothetical protein
VARTFRQIPRIQGLDKNLVKILEPMRDAIEQLINGEGRALRIPDVGKGLAFRTNKLVTTAGAAAADTGEGISQADLDALLVQFNALIASQQQFRTFIEQQLAALSIIVMGENTLILDNNGYVIGIKGGDVPGDDVEEIPFAGHTDRIRITRPVVRFELNTAYALGVFVTPSEEADISTGLIYEVTTAGTTHAADEADWATADDPGETVTSGTVTFTARTPPITFPFNMGRIENVPLPGVDGAALLDFSVPDRALQPYTRTHVVLQPEETDDTTMVLGERGRPGSDATSTQLLVVYQPEDVDDPLPLPGERGSQGGAGTAGPAGTSLPIVLQPEDSDELPVIPGERGSQGETGQQGIMSPPIVVSPEDPDELPVVPGDRGAQGATGATGSTPPPVVLQPDDPPDNVMVPGDRGTAGINGVSPAPIVLQPEDAEESTRVPGDRGTAGTNGTNGVSPPPIVLQPEDSDDPSLIPGERGATGTAGAPGGGGATSTPVVLFDMDFDTEQLPPMFPSNMPLLDAVEQIFRGRVFFDYTIITGTPRTGQINIVGRDFGSGGSTRINWFDERAAASANARRWGVVTGFGAWGLQAYDDAGTTVRSAYFVSLLTAGVVGISSASYGNNTDFPSHHFFGVTTKSFQTNSFTLATERAALAVKRFQMTGANRATLQGTSRLRVMN